MMYLFVPSSRHKRSVHFIWLFGILLVRAKLHSYWWHPFLAGSISLILSCRLNAFVVSSDFSPSDLYRLTLMCLQWDLVKKILAQQKQWLSIPLILNHPLGLFGLCTVGKLRNDVYWMHWRMLFQGQGWFCVIRIWTVHKSESLQEFIEVNETIFVHVYAFC